MGTLSEVKIFSTLLEISGPIPFPGKRTTFCAVEEKCARLRREVILVIMMLITNRL